MTYLYKRNGFTLVELAIVITIIGILIGGVLKGQQLIEQARLAATVQQVQGYKSGVAIFTAKYEELPGDMREPDNRIVGCTDCKAEGSLGNGMVGSGNMTRQPSDLKSETVRFWLHMMKADMISGVSDAALNDDATKAFGETHPKAKISGGFMARSSSGGACGSYPMGAAWSADCFPTPGLYVVLTADPFHSLYSNGGGQVLTPIQAAQIDRKMDDGAPRSGSILAAGWGTAAKNANCRSNSSDLGNTYVETATTKAVCTLAFYLWD